MFSTSSSKTSKNIQALTFPLAIVFALAVLMIVGVNIAYKRIVSMYSELKASEMEIARLQTKLDSLAEVKSASLDESNRSVIALPESNPGLFMLSQLSALAQNNNIEIVNKSVDTVEDFNENIKVAKLFIEVKAADLESVVALIKDTQTVSPLSTVSNIELNEGNDSATAEIVLNVYWSAFPDRLPALAEKITNLSAEDQEVLAKILSLSVPSFTVLNPSDPSDRENPFE